MQNKLKNTPVIPLFIAGAKQDATGAYTFSPFDFKDLDPASFPSSPHVRGDDIQFIIDDMRYNWGGRKENKKIFTRTCISLLVESDTNLLLPNKKEMR